MSTLAFKQIQAETLPDGISLPLRWIRVNQALEFYPWKRSKLYELMSSGAIKSFVYREPGCRRGIRLIDKDSIDAYLEQRALKAYAEQEAQRVAAGTKAVPGEKAAA
jgi:hypothetical protein